ncbi:CHRD domain-containing protein [Ornithinimicrobium pekingense]|uniref:CHRD domain-containing protein n=1 Tax=Ornithinimicrobium pekingense TaxID=384677 RepID=A0ABQ2F897_9MICO|nr:CHRD domain-containing protein [Ornithinimicrobium pekingense]GGK69569.1 hypothetical protein GCM10011509_17450 [Ornithinimicrobium pekingense]
MKFSTRLAAMAVPGLVALPLLAAPAVADDHGTELMATLGELNDSGGSGTAWAKVDGTSVWLSVEVQGLLDGAPHAQHIHIGGANSCPDPMMEGTGPDGAIRTTDAADSYGAVAVSLTNDGGMTGPDHALDVANFPATGTYTYERTIEVSEEVAAQIADGQGVVVVHGVDHDGSGAYDGEQMSDLDPSLPTEATDPALCGELAVGQMDAPSGGVQTGGASTEGMEYSGFAMGGAVLAAAGIGGLLLRNRRAEG